jgi:hypothetical protein
VLQVAAANHDRSGCSKSTCPKRGTSSVSSSSRSSNSSSSSSDDEADEATAARRSRARAKRARSTGHQPATTAAAADPAAGNAAQLLPPLQSLSYFPRFVRCNSKFMTQTVVLSHWQGSPLRGAAPGCTAPVSISLIVHAGDWDPDSYVTSNPPQPLPTGPQAGTTPAAAVGNSSQQVAAAATVGSGEVQAGSSGEANGHAGVSDVKLVATARLRTCRGFYVFGWHTNASEVPVKQQHAGTISPAGQGPGLQVFPGSVPDVDCVSTYCGFLHLSYLASCGGCKRASPCLQSRQGLSQRAQCAIMRLTCVQSWTSCCFRGRTTHV